METTMKEMKQGKAQSCSWPWRWKSGLKALQKADEAFRCGESGLMGCESLPAHVYK